MRKNSFLLLTIVSIYLTSCSNSPTDIAENSVELYLKENLRSPSSYDQISFTQIDTLTGSDTSEIPINSLYKINHVYSVVNSDQEKVDLSVSFYLDKDLKVRGANTSNIDGENVLKLAYLFYEKQAGNIMGEDILFLASTIDFLCYANTENYWYSGEYTFRDILDDRFRQGYKGLTQLHQDINNISTEEPEIINAIEGLEEEIIIAQQEIKETQSAIEDANGLVGMMTYGGFSGIMDLTNALSTPEEKEAAEERGRAIPENVKTAFDNLVFHLYAKNENIAWHIDVLETKTVEAINPTIEERKAIRSDLKLFIKDKISQSYRSNETDCRDKIVNQLLDYFEMEYKIAS